MPVIRMGPWMLLLLGVGTHAFPVPAQPRSTLARTGRMTTGRTGHTATRLNDGRVLMAGGAGESGAYLQSAELYDPETGAFAPVGEMNTVRYAHSATLLDDGSVLIAGGYGPDRKLLASAELYNPLTGTFTATGDMMTAQMGHAATLLRNGKVLIVGGEQGPPWPTAAGAEIYDPSTATFASAGTHPVTTTLYATGSPIWPTATLLSEGKVLIAGANPAELYDPEAGAFIVTGPMTGPEYKYGMYWHTATLLPGGKVLVAGGSDEFSMFSSAQLYDPAVGAFAATGAMSARRALHTATLLPDGTVLIAGGETWLVEGASGRFGGSLASAELYNPSAGAFSAIDRMAAGRTGHSATLLKNGSVLIAGGVEYAPYPPGGILRFVVAAEVFTPASEEAQPQ